MNSSFPPLADILLECLHLSRPIDKNKLAQLSLADWDCLFNLSVEQRVTSLLYARLKAQAAQSVVPAGVWEQLAGQSKSAATWNLVLQREFNRVAIALTEAGIPVIVLKGMHLASLVYANLSLRTMGDLDLLVPLADVFRAAKILQTLGYQSPRDLSTLELEFAMAHHLPDMVKDNRFHVELHAHLTLPYIAYAVDTQVWWDNAVTVQIAGVTVKVLDPADLLLHLGIHISYQHQLKTDLRHYYDLAVVLQFLGDKLDWAEVVARARSRGWQRGIYLVFRMAEVLFGLVLPQEVMQALSDEEVQLLPIEFALTEMWLSSEEKYFFSKDVAQFQYQRSLIGKIRYIWQRIFIPKEIMARKYPAPANSARLYFYYLVRVKDLFITQTGRVWQMWRGDQTIVTKATAKHTLWAWLNKLE